MVRGAGLLPLPNHKLGLLRQVLDDSNLRIIVDIHEWALLPESFHTRILARYEVLRPAQSETVEA